MQTVEKIVIVGGGTAGWMSAALLKKVLGDTVQVTLVESDSIGTIGVGEATIPPIRLVNSVLGLDEAEFLKETKATIKLAIRFEDWHTKGKRYYHSFGAPGKNLAFCNFHHLWLRGKELGIDHPLWEYDLNYQCAEQNRFAQVNSKDPLLDVPFAYHFDASLYAQYLRKISEAMGVKRIEGKVEEVLRHPTGDIASLQLASEASVVGDLFIDCSGFKALLIEKTLGAGFDDWSHWLPCDSAIAVPSARHEVTVPFTRSIAHSAGWQWRIPLQHRNGNGHVYCSRFMSDDEASDILMSNLDSEPLSEPKLIRFTTGRRRRQWVKNVVAIGLSSGFLEPLESTSIHLIQSGIVRLLKLFPHRGIKPAAVDEYNAQAERECLQIRDFLMMHYALNERNDEPFWRERKAQALPALLAHKLSLFAERGELFRDQEDLFAQSSWLQVMLGQGVVPQDYHPLAKSLSEPKLKDMLARLKEIKSAPLTHFPSHDEYLRQMITSN